MQEKFLRVRTQGKCRRKANRRGDAVRVKRRGKSPPAVRGTCGPGKPHPEQGRIEGRGGPLTSGYDRSFPYASTGLDKWLEGAQALYKTRLTGKSLSAPQPAACPAAAPLSLCIRCCYAGSYKRQRRAENITNFRASAWKPSRRLCGGELSGR